jgi:hypothetical protein
VPSQDARKLAGQQGASAAAMQGRAGQQQQQQRHGSAAATAGAAGSHLVPRLTLAVHLQELIQQVVKLCSGVEQGRTQAEQLITHREQHCAA